MGRDNFKLEDSPEIASRNYGDVHYPLVKIAHSKTKEASRQFPLPASSDLLERIYIRRGEVAGIESLQKFGRNIDVDSGGEEDIWDGGSAYTFPTTATVIPVFSSSTSDTAGGAGARTVRITGLDADYNEIEEDVDLSGTTPVNTANSFLRVYRARVVDVGAGGTNIGIIFGTAPAFQIRPGAGQTNMAIYTVPAGKTGYITKISASCRNDVGTASVEVHMNLREYETGANNHKFYADLYTAGTSTLIRDFDAPIVVPEKSDVWFTATTSRNDTFVNVSFDMVLCGG